MPCASAIIKDIKPLSPDQEIQDIIDLFRSYHVDQLPVLDKEGILLGFFSLHVLLKNLLPVSINIPNMPKSSPELTLKAAPGIAKRLRKTLPLKVEDLMERDFQSVTPEMPLWEGIVKMIETKKPVMVVEAETNKYLGMITRLSALEELERMVKEEEKTT